MSNYLPEGYLTYYEYKAFEAALPDCTLVNAHPIVDRLQMIKDIGTINRFREASRIVERRTRGRARRAEKRRMEGHDGDGDCGPCGLCHAQGGQHV